MKKISISKCIRGISTGILMTALSLMAGTVITQAESVKEGENCVISLTQEVKLDMIWIKPGTFMMGSPKDELGRSDHETQHQVTLTKGYWLGKYEVTQRQWKAVMKKNPSQFVGDDLPVDQVSWKDAMEFCRKLTERERNAERLPSGYEYTLPTEAQWEYACRAGTTTALNSGKNVTTTKAEGICDNLDEVGWYWMNGGKENWNVEKDPAFCTLPALCTHSVGQKKPNNWGLYDMHGNVCEWCLDWAGEYPTGAVSDPVGPDTSTERIHRGGCWFYSPSYCRSADRSTSKPADRSLNVGFRLALTPVK